MTVKMASVSSASVFVAIDTNKYFDMKIFVMPVSACSDTYCICHTSGDGNGEIEDFKTLSDWCFSPTSLGTVKPLLYENRLPPPT